MIVLKYIFSLILVVVSLVLTIIASVSVLPFLISLILLYFSVSLFAKQHKHLKTKKIH